MTGTVAYILSKKLAMGIASGISNVSLKGNTIIFQFKDGTQGSIAIPMPQDGEDGKDGVSIADIKFNDKNHLICTLSDGTTIDAGELKCDCAGSGGVVQAADKTAFPQTGDTDMLYLALDTKTLYYWNNNEYKVISSDSSSLDLGLATNEDIDSLFSDDGDFGNFGLATNEDIDSLFE